MLTVEKIGGTSMSQFKDVLNNIIKGDRSASEMYNRIFVVSAYNNVTNWLLEHKKTGEPGIYVKFLNDDNYDSALDELCQKLIALNRGFEEIKLDQKVADEFIINRIEKAKNYLKEPIVMADFMNFQITMLGEVNNKGNFSVENNEINLIQAIAMAGDLTTNAKRDEILVIRTENGERKVYPVNMLSRDLYESPAFQLQQNDVVYAKPNKAKSDGQFERRTTTISLLLTFITAISSMYYWVIK